MTSTVKRKSMALVMALLMCFSMFVSFGTTAQAAGERSEIYMVSFPRDAENNRDHWDRDNLQFMNGWYMDAYDMFATFAVGSYEGKVALVAGAIMRLAMYEILYMPEIPNAAAINEAVELAKKYESGEVVRFVNGILGTFVRSEAEETAKAPPVPAGGQAE